MLAKAKVVSKEGKMTPNGREMIMQVRSGAKGTGKVLGAVIYCPWSASSSEVADNIVAEIAERNEVELVYDEQD